MKAHVSRLAGIGLFVAVSSASALAQDALGTAPNGFRAPPNPLGTVNGLGTPNALSTAPNALGPAPNRLGSPSLGTLPLPESWTTDNVTAARPFGTIDVSHAGVTTAQVRTWSLSRTPQERNELQGRCAVINESANSSRYSQDAREFCRTYLVVAQGVPAPTTKY